MGHVSEMVGTMSTKIVTVQEAEGRLLELIALVEQGEEVVITYDDQPKVKLVPLVKPSPKRVFGQHRGQIWMSPDFDDPLPDDFWLGGSP
jgi:antitoxin (DNA-binding transcriptional repressor) of toxin-antitoxin stability system